MRVEAGTALGVDGLLLLSPSLSLEEDILISNLDGDEDESCSRLQVLYTLVLACRVGSSSCHGLLGS